MGKIYTSSCGGNGADLSTITVTEAQILSPYTSVDKNGELITGTISSKEAATYYPSTSDQTIDAGQYLNGAQKISKISMSNLSAENIKTGTVVTVNNGNEDIVSVTGSFCSDATLSAANKLLSGVIAYGKNGTKYTGSIASMAGKTVTPTTEQQTVSCSGKYMTGNIIVNAIEKQTAQIYSCSETIKYTGLIGTGNISSLDGKVTNGIILKDNITGYIYMIPYITDYEPQCLLNDSNFSYAISNGSFTYNLIGNYEDSVTNCTILYYW